jgi:hypothetical protein
MNDFVTYLSIAGHIQEECGNIRFVFSNISENFYRTVVCEWQSKGWIYTNDVVYRKYDTFNVVEITVDCYLTKLGKDIFTLVSL